MQSMRFILLAACTAAGALSPICHLSGQEPKTQSGNMIADIHSMAKDAMDMKKAKEMAGPAMMQKAKEQLMAGDMLPNALARETTMAMAMKDENTMKMVQENAMARMSDAKPKISDEQIKAAIRKVFSDPVQFQSLLQTLILRETAANMTSTNAEKTSASMMRPEMELKMASEKMMVDEEISMKMAKEMMIQAMMMDKEISMAVKEAAMKPADPIMMEMVKSESMMVAKEKLSKEPAMRAAMATEAIIREMAKSKGMMSDKKK